jgi:hypothetical protein
MNRRTGLLLAAGLCLATPALAQTKVSPDELVPATPESIGVSPEVFAKMGIPKGAMIRKGSSRIWSDGSARYAGPVALPAPPLRAVPLAPDTVVAAAAVRYDQERWRTTGPISVGAPFNLSLPADSRFSGSLGAEGARPCLSPRPYSEHKLAEDEKGNEYPGTCLAGRDGSGRYTIIRMLPWYPDRAKPRDMPIAPVALTAIPAGTSDPYFGAIQMVRRLRVDSVTPGSALVLLELGMQYRNAGDAETDPFAAAIEFRPQGAIELPLRDGASASLAGVTLTARRAGGGWSVEPSGAFADWASLSEDRAVLKFGDLTWGPRPR